MQLALRGRGLAASSVPKAFVSSVAKPRCCAAPALVMQCYVVSFPLAGSVAPLLSSFSRMIDNAFAEMERGVEQMLQRSLKAAAAWPKGRLGSATAGQQQPPEAALLGSGALCCLGRRSAPAIRCHEKARVRERGRP